MTDHDIDKRIAQLRRDGVSGTISHTARKVIGELSDEEFRHLRSIRTLAIKEGASQEECDHWICLCV